MATQLGQIRVQHISKINMCIAVREMSTVDKVAPHVDTDESCGMKVTPNAICDS